MSREKDVMLDKYNQLIDLLEETDPIKHPSEFVSVLDLLDRLHFSIDRQFDHNYPVPVNCACKSEPSIEEYAPPVMVTPEPEEPAQPEPGIKGEAEHTYTKEEVRAALAKSRKEGINVTELLGELGYDNFSAVPAGRYGEIMGRLVSGDAE